jgi:hypothetical protein
LDTSLGGVVLAVSYQRQVQGYVEPSAREPEAPIVMRCGLTPTQPASNITSSREARRRGWRRIDRHHVSAAGHECGWDAVDALAEGWTAQRVAALITSHGRGAPEEIRTPEPQIRSLRVPN